MGGLGRKYVVFKADEFDKWWEDNYIRDFSPPPPPAAIDDAVVLRKQDIFTSSALYEYAGQIRTTIEIIEKGLTIDETPESLMMRLRILADSFADAAEEAEQYNRKVPD